MTTTIEAPAKPASLVEVAAGLDEHLTAIRSVEDEIAQDEAEVAAAIEEYRTKALAALAERTRDRQARIAARRGVAKGLHAHMQRLVEPVTASIFGRPASKAPRGGSRVRSAATPAGRKRDADHIRKHAIERRLEGAGRPGRVPSAHVEDYLAHGGSLEDPAHWASQSGAAQG